MINNLILFNLRLVHLFAVGEDPVYSKPATVDVSQLLSNFKIITFQETTLTANQGKRLLLFPFHLIDLFFF